MVCKSRRNKTHLGKIIRTLKKISRDIPVLFPLHPRTRKRIEQFSLKNNFVFNESNNSVKDNALYAMKPFGYLDFLHLMMKCSLVLTDSGGIQEETSFLGIPCLTMRTTTERPVTLTHGTNFLVGGDSQKLLYHTERVLNGFVKKSTMPKYWDGKTAFRILNILQNA